MLDYKEYVNNASQNLHRYLLCLLVPFLLAACSREPEFDRNFKKSCEATSYGKTSYCECALGIVKRNIKGDALLTMSTKDLEPLAPKFSEPARQNNQDEAIKTHISIQEMQAFNLARRRFENPIPTATGIRPYPCRQNAVAASPCSKAHAPSIWRTNKQNSSPTGPDSRKPAISRRRCGFYTQDGARTNSWCRRRDSNSHSFRHYPSR